MITIPFSLTGSLFPGDITSLNAINQSSIGDDLSLLGMVTSMTSTNTSLSGTSIVSCTTS